MAHLTVRILIRILLAAGLAVATWGLVITVPAALATEPGYLARTLYLVAVWALIWVSCLVVLIRSLRRSGSR